MTTSMRINIIIIGEKEQIDRFVSDVAFMNKVFSFQKLLPPPVGISEIDATPDEGNNHQLFCSEYKQRRASLFLKPIRPTRVLADFMISWWGHGSVYSWRMAHWGCSDISSADIISRSPLRVQYSIVVENYTHPIFFQKISEKYPLLTFGIILIDLSVPNVHMMFINGQRVQSPPDQRTRGLFCEEGE